MGPFGDDHDHDPQWKPDWVNIATWTLGFVGGLAFWFGVAMYMGWV